MTRLQLAIIVRWAGTLKSRKRLQKTAYMLQANGAPIDADYSLHKCGPYASEVAGLTDQMVHVGLLKEFAESNTNGNQFNYSLSERAARQLLELQRKPEGIAGRNLAPFEDTAMRLLRIDVTDLEIAATIGYFRKHGRDWPEAARSAAKFKAIQPDGAIMHRAVELARSLIA